MGKYKAAKKKSDVVTPQMRPGAPCLVIIIGAMIVVVLVMVLAMRNAG